MNKNIKVGIFGANPFSENRGVGALAYSILYILQNVASEQKLELDITLINSTSSKYSIQVKGEDIYFKSVKPLNPFSIISLAKILISPKEWKNLMMYLSFDYVMNLGEGDSFSDIYGLKRFNKFNNQHRLSRLLNKKYLLLPQTIGPFKNSWVKKRAKKSIEKASLVLARDNQSYEYVKKYTRQKNILESIDVAFYLPFEKQEFSKNLIHVGLNISGLLWNGGYTRNNQFELTCDYKKLIQNIIDYFLLNPKIQIHLIPHVVMSNSHVENDYEVSLNLIEKYKNDRLTLAPFFLTPIMAKNYISGLGFFIGSRMHSTIAAFSSGVPVYPLAYSRKFNGLFLKTLNYRYMGDLVNEEREQIMEQIKDAFYNRKQLQKTIDDRLMTIVKQRNIIIQNQIKEFLK